jgi:hypothetical protein
LAEAQEAAVIVGVDVAKRAHWARVIDPRGRELVKPLRFDNSRVGFLRLEQVLAEALGGVGLERVIVGLEPSGHYWKPLAWHLYSRGIRVVLVNPYHVKCSKELDDNSQLKSDCKDALLAASLVSPEKLQGWDHQKTLINQHFEGLKGIGFRILSVEIALQTKPTNTSGGNPNVNHSPRRCHFLRGSSPMLRLKSDPQLTLWDCVLPSELTVLSEELSKVDRLLDDEQLLMPFVERFNTRIGRPSVPVEPTSA